MDVRIANAPVSYGAFELTVGVMPGVPASGRILAEVSQAGYSGIDLGPEGYLAGDGDLGGALEEGGLTLAGAYLALPFSESTMGEGFGALERLLETLGSVTDPSVEPHLRPKPTLADAGSPERLGRIGQARDDRTAGLGANGWRAMSANVAAAVDLCRQAGFEPTFHHHAGSYVEAPWEIDRLLEVSDIGLCLDTGHLVVGGGEPNDVLDRLAGRVNHIHLKDVVKSTVDQIVAESAPVTEIWRRQAFCRLGSGDLDVAGFLSILTQMSYKGWIVVEQDRLPESAEDIDEMIADQEYNRRFLERMGR